MPISIEPMNFCHVINDFSRVEKGHCFMINKDSNVLRYTFCLISHSYLEFGNTAAKYCDTILKVLTSLKIGHKIMLSNEFFISDTLQLYITILAVLLFFIK